MFTISVATHLCLFYLARLFMCLFVWFLDISPLPHRVQWYRFYSIILLQRLFLVVPWYDFPFTQCIRIKFFSSMTLHVAPGEGFFLAHREQWYRFFIVWIFMWRLVWSVVAWYLLFTFRILIWSLWIICPFGKFSMLYTQKEQNTLRIH